MENPWLSFSHPIWLQYDESEKRRKRAKFSLERYTHYYERWATNESVCLICDHYSCFFIWMCVWLYYSMSGYVEVVTSEHSNNVGLFFFESTSHSLPPIAPLYTNLYLSYLVLVPYCSMNFFLSDCILYFICSQERRHSKIFTLCKLTR